MALGDILLKKGLVTPEILDMAAKEQGVLKMRIGETLQAMGYVSESDLAEAVAENAEMKFRQVVSFEDVDWRVAEQLGAEYLRTQGAIPFANGSAPRVIGITDPFDNKIRGSLRYALKTDDLSWVVITKSAVQRFVQIFESRQDRHKLEEYAHNAEDLGAGDASEPIRVLAEGVMRVAAGERASDIHLEPKDNLFRVWLRRDGRLRHVMSVSPKVGQGLVGFWKVKAGIKEVRGQAGDGAFRAGVNGVDIDVRVSVVPAVSADSMVLRLHNERAEFWRLSELGFSEKFVNKIQSAISYANGMFLVTGPTGSGKTTTLYAALDHIKRISWSMLTVEDPVECRLSFLTQTQVNEGRNWVLNLALRSFLRHDPDVILVGEIRDNETAKIAIDSAQTGRLVLSTLHTNSAMAVLPRLLGLGVDAMGFEALRGSMAQRLIPRLCPECKQPVDLRSLKAGGQLGVSGRKDTIVAMAVARTDGRGFEPHPYGCDYCGKTGYRGRRVVGELVEFTAEFLEAFDAQALRVRGAEMIRLREIARGQGFVPMAEAGLDLVAEGEISLRDLVEQTV